MIDGRENLLTDDERQRWLRGIQAAEAEELACLEPAADMPRDRRIADAVVRRMAAPPPTAMLTRRALLAAAVVTAGIGIWQAPRWLVAPQPKLLATYKLGLRGNAGVMGPEEPLVASADLTSHSTLHIDLQPKENVGGEIAYRAYLMQSGGALIPIAVELTRSTAGRLQGTKLVSELSETTLPAGTWSIFFVLARAGALPSDTEVAQVVATGTNPNNKTWQLLSGQLTLKR